MRAYKCDRCGKLFEKYKFQGTSEFFNITNNPCMSGSCLDLCPNCNSELQEWVANGKEQTDLLLKECEKDSIDSQLEIESKKIANVVKY